MKWNIAEALRLPGETFEIAAEEMLEPQSYSGRQIVPCAPALLQARYAFDGKTIQLDGELKLGLSEVCARCASDYALALELPIRERFVRGGMGEEEEAYAFEGDSLDLTQMVWDNIFLNLPIAGVCREECRGLCPICGCNLNMTQCDCVAEKP